MHRSITQLMTCKPHELAKGSQASIECELVEMRDRIISLHNRLQHFAEETINALPNDHPIHKRAVHILERLK